MHDKLQCTVSLLAAATAKHSISHHERSQKAYAQHQSVQEFIRPKLAAAGCRTAVMLPLCCPGARNDRKNCQEALTTAAPSHQSEVYVPTRL